MKRIIAQLMICFLMISIAIAADLSDPVDRATVSKSGQRYQSYTTLGTYTSVTINVLQDLGRSGGLGYVLNKGSQIIQIYPNYFADTTNSMNGINVAGSNVVWNFSPSNFKLDTLKIRSTTAATLNLEIVLH